MINVIWSTWEHAQAMAFMRIPETQQHKENKNKSECARRLCRLADTASIRSAGVWTCGTPATESERRWAQDIWPFPVKTKVEGPKGLLAICDGEIT